jgi:hypothetical protein
MKSLDDLRRFFDTDLKTDLDALEARRKSVAARVLVIGIGAACLTVGSLALYFVIDAYAVIPAAGFIVLWAILHYFTVKGYASDFKAKVIARIVKFIDPGLDYKPAACIPLSDYQASGIFRTRPDRYRGDDLVTGKLGKTAIAFSELHSEYKTTTHSSNGGTQTTWHTIFKGLFFIADFNKRFKGETFVLPDMAQRAFGKVLGNLFQSWNKGRGQLVKMEDPDFEREFVVYGGDQIEARYILSTSLMRRIYEYKNKTKKTMYLSFLNDKIYVALSYTKNLFEPKLFKSLLDFGVIQEYYEDLSYAAGLVEELNLNTRIWSKAE